ncbi:MAG TPA: DUF2130 domain-containing protein [bacterium]|jgi:hypothetical protein
MSEQQIKCPKCGHNFAVTEAMTQQIANEYREKYKSAAADLQAKYEQKLEEERKGVEQQIKERLEAEKVRAREDVAVELKDLQAQLEEKAKKLDEAHTLELDLRKKQRDLDERARNIELELTRKMAEERDGLLLEGRKRADEEHELKLKEKEKQLGDALKQVDEMKRKLEQGSQQTQGEILELELEEQLRINFPDDEIQPVAKGVRGGDVIQRIAGSGDPLCILYEFKNTKNWSDGWVSKLKQDQRECKAEMAVLVTRALPKEISCFGQKDGVWVTDFASAIGVACVLRESLIRISYARTAAEGMSYKMELIYKYLSGPEFRQRVEAIVENIRDMQKDLNDEMRRITKLWEKRQTQLMIMQSSTISIHGKLHAIIGNALSEIPVLQLPPEDGRLEIGNEK